MNAAPGSMVLAALAGNPASASEAPASAPGEPAFAAALAATVAPTQEAPDGGGLLSADQAALALPSDMPSAAALALIAAWLPAHPSPNAPQPQPADGTGGMADGGATALLAGAAAPPSGGAALAATPQVPVAPPEGTPGPAQAASVPGDPMAGGAAAAAARAGHDKAASAAAGALSLREPATLLQDAADGSGALDPLRQLARALGSFGTADRAESAVTTRGAMDPASALSLGLAVREHPATSLEATPLPDTVRSPPGTPRWSEEVASRVMLMSLRGQQEGSLTLTPEHLGPVEVRISVSQDVTSVWFGAAHPDTRAALGDALPRLREMFAAAGLALGEAGVSHQAPRQEPRASRPAEGGVAGAGAAGEADLQAVRPAARILHARLLDAWA